MRAILGVNEPALAYKTFESLLQLQFADLELYPTHIIEHVGSTFGKYLLTATEGDFYSLYMQSERSKAKAMLDTFEKQVRELNVPCHSQLREGHVANELINQVNETEADLVCVSLPNQETLGRFLLGSVGRKLIFLCPSSFFVHKPLLAAPSLRRAVFATDHSPFAQRALERLIRFRPKGLQHITVLSAFPQSVTAALAPFVGKMGSGVSQWVEEKLKEENRHVVERLERAGFNAESEIRSEEVHAAIDNCMQQHEAGLLILGAQGHGMLEGLSLGSVVAHQVLHTQHSVLVIRP